MDESNSESPIITRRRLLYAAGATALVGGTVAAVALRGEDNGDDGKEKGGKRSLVSGERRASENSDVSVWSDEATWEGGLPGSSDIAEIRSTILLDQDVALAGVIIVEGGKLLFDPEKDVSLVCTGNIEVHGELEMVPANARRVHRVIFADVDENAFQGDGRAILNTDVGLWVIGKGRIFLSGEEKKAWTRAAGTVSKGTSWLELAEEPAGWGKGDEIVITPTGPHDTRNAIFAYDTALVEEVSGRRVRLSTPTLHEHPVVSAGRGRKFAAEVLNLSRNVQLEGTSSGRAHVLIMTSVPQEVSHVAFRYMGPRQPGEKDATVGVLGRYGLHFHHCEEGSRGSVVNGVVVRDTGNHAFVPHDSHGITFRDCISHNTFEDAYWWDPPTEEAENFTHDLTYASCVASLIQADPDYRAYRLAGFWLGRGEGNVARDCVAVGVRGSRDASGFIWPEFSHGVWEFQDCLAHHCREHGIFVWQNTGMNHFIERFTGYRNDGAGISHGAYRNRYRYQDCVLYDNTRAGVLLHATGSPFPGMEFRSLFIDSAGNADYAVEITRHQAEGATPTLFVDCDFTGCVTAAVGGFTSHQPDNLQLLNCKFADEPVLISPEAHLLTEVRIQDKEYGSIRLTPQGRGRSNAKWNARVQNVSPVSIPGARSD